MGDKKTKKKKETLKKEMIIIINKIQMGNLDKKINR